MSVATRLLANFDLIRRGDKMILPRTGKWSCAGGRFLVWDRLYYFGKPTILCRISIRYLKTQQEMTSSNKAIFKKPHETT